MGIDHDDAAERQARVERMIAEFRDAQWRRFGKPNNAAVESKSDAVESKSDTNAQRPGTPVSL
jgi:hypothetical protein